MLREARLSPYTYFYDHAPAGWLVIAAWLSVLPSQLQTFGNAINTGRVLMLLIHLANVYFLFQITRRLTGSLTAAVVAIRAGSSPLHDANRALQALKHDRVRGAAVLRVHDAA